MKKFMMTLAAILCCALTITVFTSCGSDDDVRDYTYSIRFSGFYYNAEGDFKFSDWMHEVAAAYENALGVTSDKFTFHGTESECNERVSECCKKAEETVQNIPGGGTATVVITNNTTGKIVYTYSIK